MTTLVTVIHVLVCFILIIVILLQAGKGGMGSAFGGGGASSVFGGRGATTFLSKITSACAVLFMVTSMTLSYLATKSTSVVRGDGPLPSSAQQQVPASPLTPPGGSAPPATGQSPGAPAPGQQSPAAPAPAQESAPARPQQPGK